MTPHVAQFRDRIALHYPDVEVLDDSVLRFTRKRDDAPFAVYYVAAPLQLPSDLAALTRFQDRVIGSHYFEGRKSLQWNNYLYFITNRETFTDAQTRAAKELIEGDRKYARKFVIAPNELDGVLTPTAVKPDAAPQTSVLALWMERLAGAGIEKAVLSDKGIPKKLEMIETSESISLAREVIVQRRATPKALPFLRSLHLKQFRPFPIQKEFDFGMVNLIFGPNAAGKTSLLEAIELYYCGRNKRNYDTVPRYELVATMHGGEPETVTNARSLQVFRDRNLTWYGQSEVKTKDLFRSFSRYNFLDTDAAVSLSESTSHIEEDLSRLLIGPDASQTWQEMERLLEAVTSKVKDLRTRVAQIEEEIVAMDASVTAPIEAQKESDSLRTQLNTMMQHLGWREASQDSNIVVSELTEALSELLSLLDIAATITWAKAPTSIETIAAYCAAAHATCAMVDAQIEQLAEEQQRHRALTVAVARERNALKAAQEIKRIIEADIPSRAEELARARDVAAKYAGWLAGFDPIHSEALSQIDGGLGVAEHRKYLADVLSNAQDTVLSAQREYKHFIDLRDQSLSLAQELRQIAAKMLADTTDPDRCPLCHTQFEQGALKQHMRAEVDTFEATSQQLQKRITEARELASSLTTSIKAISWLEGVCQRAELAPEITISAALAEVDEMGKLLSESRFNSQRLERELKDLQQQGLSVAEIDARARTLRQANYELQGYTVASVQGAIANMLERISTLSAEVSMASDNTEKLKQPLQSRFNTTEEGIDFYRDELSLLQERIATTQQVQRNLELQRSSYPWPAAKSLAELAVDATSLRSVAADLQTALVKEERAAFATAESAARRKVLDQQQAELRPRLRRLSHAQSVLISIRRDLSLKNAMQSALQNNRGAIEEIFSRIHAPAEFAGIGSTVSTLVRKNSRVEAKLSEVSTGQRAAFALSIFLSQNAQLKTAPPVLLIDDPIAHVDDLNCLSFLDYLREIAISETRQIFFATADDKLAALFERKFDFLGSEFQRFNFARQ